jgi:hypothetical protein
MNNCQVRLWEFQEAPFLSD